MSETNCPNCGAPIVSHQCAYCGTVHNFREYVFGNYSGDVKFTPVLHDRELIKNMVANGVLSVNEARQILGGVR